MSRKRAKRGRRIGRAVLVVLAASVAMVVAVGVWLFRRPGPPEPAAARQTPAPQPTASPAPKKTRRPSALPADFESAGAARGVVAVVLDDLGYERVALDALDSIRAPLALAILPGTPHAREAAALAARKRWDVLVHLPMDTDGGRMEPHSVGTKDDDATIRRRVGEALDEVPGALGLNNHQGSSATADARVARAVLGVVHDRSLFFLDSRTTAATVASREARALGVPTLERDVFLDDAAAGAASPAGAAGALDGAWARALQLARSKGSCVVIGHPHPETLRFLSAKLPELARAGVAPVRVSELLEN